MSQSKAKKFRKVHKRTAENMVTEEVRKKVYKLAHQRDWLFVACISELIGIVLLIIF